MAKDRIMLAIFNLAGAVALLAGDQFRKVSTLPQKMATGAVAVALKRVVRP